MQRLVVSLDAAASASGTLGIAVADAFIACWRTKYRHHLLRPVTYVNRVIEPSWTPLLTTPPFPEYTSGHSVQAAAAAQVLTDLFGDVAFTDHTTKMNGHRRTRMALAARLSRVLCVAAASLVASSDAHAIGNGVPDGDGHPNIGPLTIQEDGQRLLPLLGLLRRPAQGRSWERRARDGRPLLGLAARRWHRRLAAVGHVRRERRDR